MNAQDEGRLESARRALRAKADGKFGVTLTIDESTVAIAALDERETRGDLLREILGLCELGDVTEETEAYGWGELIRRAKVELGETTRTRPVMVPLVLPVCGCRETHGVGCQVQKLYSGLIAENYGMRRVCRVAVQLIEAYESVPPPGSTMAALENFRAACRRFGITIVEAITGRKR